MNLPDEPARDALPEPQLEPRRTLITSYREYDEGVDALLTRARRHLAIFDPDARRLHLNERTRIESLEQFLRGTPTTSIEIVLHATSYVERECPRLIDLLRFAGDRMRIHRAVGDAARAQDCFVIADESHCVRRPVAAQSRGVIIEDDAREVALQRERFAQILASAELAVSATTLGL
jgi:hypothetical protein